MFCFNDFVHINILQCLKKALDDDIYCEYYVGCFIEKILSTCATNINVNVSRFHNFKGATGNFKRIFV